MPPMGPITGMWGSAVVSGEVLTTLGNWQITNGADTKAFAASNTRGGTSRRKGNTDWSGSYKQFAAWPTVGCMPGDIFDFIGCIGPRSGTYGDAGPYVAGPCIVESVQLTIDWNTNAIIEMLTTIAGTGPLLAQTPEDYYVDESNPVGWASSEAEVKISDGAGQYFQLCAQRLVLTLRAANQVFSNSCGAGYMQRRRGILDWGMVITLDEPDVTALPLTLKPNMYIETQIEINSPTNKWSLKYGLVKEFANFNVDVETSALLTYDVTVEMSADGGPNTAVAEPYGVKVPGFIDPYFPPVVLGGSLAGMAEGPKIILPKEKELITPRE